MTHHPMIVILALARSGTNLLRDIIAGSGAYENTNEIFLSVKDPSVGNMPYNYWKSLAELGLDPAAATSPDDVRSQLRAYLDRARRRAAGRELCIDIKEAQIKFLGEQDGQPMTIRALAEEGARFIHLRRRNLLEQVASHERALLTEEWIRNEWLLKRKPVRDVRITLDTGKLMNSLLWHESSQNRMAQMLAPFSPLDLYYEDLMEDGHPSPDLRHKLKEIMRTDIAEDYVPKVMKIAGPLEVLVDNMDEVRDLLANTRFEKFLSPSDAQARSPAATPAVGSGDARWLPRLVPLCRSDSGIVASIPPISSELQLSPGAEPGYVLRPRGTVGPGLYALVVNEGVTRAPLKITLKAIDGTAVPFEMAGADIRWRRGFAGLFFSDQGDFRLRIRTTAELGENSVSLHHLSQLRPTDTASADPRCAGAIILGAQDASAAAFFRRLDRRSDVWINPLREIGFLAAKSSRQNRFCRMLAAGHPLSRSGRGLGLLVDFAFAAVTDAAWYLRMFSLAPAGRLLLDVSPRYSAFDEDGIKALKAAAPAARIVIVMHNPVERALAAAWQKMASGATRPSPEEFETECFTPANLERSDACGILTRWEAVFGRRNVMVIFDEDIATSPADVMAGVASFLGFDPAGEGSAAAASFKREPSPGYDDPAFMPVRARLAAHFLPQLEWLSLHFGGRAEVWLQEARGAAST